MLWEQFPNGLIRKASEKLISNLEIMMLTDLQI